MNTTSFLRWASTFGVRCPRFSVSCLVSTLQRAWAGDTLKGGHRTLGVPPLGGSGNTLKRAHLTLALACVAFLTSLTLHAQTNYPSGTIFTIAGGGTNGVGNGSNLSQNL